MTIPDGFRSDMSPEDLDGFGSMRVWTDFDKSYTPCLKDVIYKRLW